jgi:hypothetical protein
LLVILFNDAVTDALCEYSKLHLKKHSAKKLDGSDLAKFTGTPTGKSSVATGESDLAGTIDSDIPDLWTTLDKYLKDKITLRAFGQIIGIPHEVIDKLSPGTPQSMGYRPSLHSFG